jgi:hypothetical protein
MGERQTPDTQKEMNIFFLTGCRGATRRERNNLCSDYYVLFSLKVKLLRDHTQTDSYALWQVQAAEYVFLTQVLISDLICQRILFT